MAGNKGGIKKVGDWKRVGRITKTMRRDIEQINQRSLQRVALMAEGNAVKHVQNQDLNWQPLSPKYAARKQAKGLSSKILIATSTMYQAITSVVRKGVGFAGVLRTARGKNGEVLANVAATHEYGSVRNNIPARPLWHVVYQEVYTYIRQTNFFSREIINHWRRR